jgi:hypothetical protein
MDRQFQTKGNNKLAIVARQFMPCRIERQLLTQVFRFLLANDRESQQDTANSYDHQVTDVASSLTEIDSPTFTVRRAS